MQSMRVAVVSRWRPDRADGVDQAVTHHSRELVKLGCSIEIWEASPKYHTIRSREAERGIVVYELPIRLKGLVIPDETRQFVERQSANLNVVHFHSCFVPANVFFARFLKCPYVITPHGGYSSFRIRLRGYIRKSVFFALFSRRYLQEAAFVHVLSTAEREAVEELCRPRRFVVATSGCIGFPPAPIPWGAPHPGRHLLFIGRLDVACKGLDRALYAFAWESREGDHLTLAGPDFRGGAEKLRHIAALSGVAERVTIRDGIFGEEKTRLISESDVFIQLSRWEGVPLTPIEAMGVGRPLLVTPATNLADYVATAEAGWIAHDEDCRTGMRECLQASEAELHARGANARRLAETQFQWHTTVKRIYEAYRTVTE